MSEKQAVEIYREIMGSSEAQAKSAYMYMDMRFDLAKHGRNGFTELAERAAEQSDHNPPPADAEKRENSSENPEKSGS